MSGGMDGWTNVLYFRVSERIPMCDGNIPDDL